MGGKSVGRYQKGGHTEDSTSCCFTAPIKAEVHANNCSIKSFIVVAALRQENKGRQYTKNLGARQLTGMVGLIRGL